MTKNRCAVLPRRVSKVVLTGQGIPIAEPATAPAGGRPPSSMDSFKPRKARAGGPLLLPLTQEETASRNAQDLQPHRC